MPGRERSFKLMARLKAETENEAALALRTAEERLAQAEGRLEAVQALRDEYRARADFVSGDVRQLRAARGFVTQLEEALQMQMGAVDAQRRVTEAARAQWVSARMQREALDRLLEERDAAEARQREGREQRRADESAARVAEEVFARTGVFAR